MLSVCRSSYMYPHLVKVAGSAHNVAVGNVFDILSRQYGLKLVRKSWPCLNLPPKSMLWHYSAWLEKRFILLMSKSFKKWGMAFP